MKKVLAAQIIGLKDSGKTHLILELCKFFKKRELKIGCIKYTHHSLDKADSDTDKMSKLADVVAGISEENSQVFFNKKKAYLDLRSFFDVDILLVEGGKHEIDFLPQIVVVDNRDDMPLYNEDLLIGVFLREGVNIDIKNNIIVTSNAEDIGNLILDKGYYLPGLNCGACNMGSCSEMGKNILINKAKEQDCVVLQDDIVKVNIDGHPLDLNPFVKQIVRSTILGLLSTLKGYHNGEITITIKS